LIVKVGKPERSKALTLNDEWLPQLHTQKLSNDTENIGIAHNSGINIMTAIDSELSCSMRVASSSRTPFCCVVTAPR